MGRRQFGTVRRLASARYQARYTDQLGHQVAAPGSFTTKTEAMRWLAAAQTDIPRGHFVEPSAGQMLFTAWAEEWLATKPGQRAATLARDRVAIQTHFLPIIGEMGLGSITPAHIRRVVRDMQATGLSAKSVRTYVGTLQAMFASAVEADVIVRSPVRVRSLGLQTVVRRERPTLTAEQLEALTEVVPNRYAALVLLAGVTGLRWGEAIGLRIGDVDFLRRTVSVSQTVEEVSGVVKVVGATKTAASRRRFSIPTFLAERLSAHVAEYRPESGPGDLLFVGPKGGLLRRSFLARTFRPAVVAAGLPEGLTFHGLRHVAASLLVTNGEHPKVIQARLGHSDPSISLGIYAHVSDDLDRAVGDRLGSLFELGSAEQAA